MLNQSKSFPLPLQIFHTEPNRTLKVMSVECVQTAWRCTTRQHHTDIPSAVCVQMAWRCTTTSHGHLSGASWHNLRTIKFSYNYDIKKALSIQLIQRDVLYCRWCTVAVHCTHYSPSCIDISCTVDGVQLLFTVLTTHLAVLI